MKQRNQMDDQCKRVKARIKENRDKYKQQDLEFGSVFRDDVIVEVPEDRVVEQQRPGSMTPRQSQIIDLDGAESQNPSKRLRQGLQGFEHHLANTPITYNFTEQEITLL
jgi:hypothetical protein